MVIRFILVLLVTIAVTVRAAEDPAKIMAMSDAAPIIFGVSELKADALSSSIHKAAVTVGLSGNAAMAIVLKKNSISVPDKAGSFVIVRDENIINIIGCDAGGAMYGCLELAERIQMEGKNALKLKSPIVQSPFVELRGINLFLTLPYGKETMENWWFVQDDFWEGYLDMLARARINWLDIHGMYDIKQTNFPNIYPYFVRSGQFPEAGIDEEIAARNLKILQKVVKMAADRGISVGIMSYSTGFGTGCKTGSYDWKKQENNEKYIKECVINTVKACPELAMIGFRVGESGQGDDFYLNSYIPAIRECGRDIQMYTRSWGAEKPKIVEMGNAFPGRMIVEIKYNGEHYGPPYIVAGGKMATWRDYSYQNYFSWPHPYKVVYQIRLNGTQRVFPWGSPEMVRITARNTKLGGTEGFCIEPLNAYYPMYNYQAKPDVPGAWYKWVYQRDWMFYDTWGRVSYDPNISEKIWEYKFEQRFGKAGKDLYRAFAKSGEIIPRAYTFFGMHPDHRGHAPELETGGDVMKWASSPAQFDQQNYQNPKEYARRLIDNDPSARCNPMQAASLLDNLADTTMRYVNKAKRLGGESSEFKSLCTDMEMLACIAHYNAARLRSATYFSFYELACDPAMAKLCRIQHAKAIEYWNNLAALGQANYQSFVDTLRMHTEKFTWADEAMAKDGSGPLAGHLAPLDKLEKENHTIKHILSNKNFAKDNDSGPVISVAKEALSATVNGVRTLTIAAKVKDWDGVGSVKLKYKPFPSESEWRYVDMGLKDGRWTASLDVFPYGVMWAIEALDKNGNGSMWPDFQKDIPYRWVKPWKEAGSFIADMNTAIQDVLANPTKYKAIVIGRRASLFNKADPAIKSKLLEAVKNGMLLYIDCQKFEKFDLSWLPGDLKAKNEWGSKIKTSPANRIFDGLDKELVNHHIVSAVFEANDTWKLLGEPTAIAVLPYGKGMIVLNQVQMFERPIGWTSYPLLLELAMLMENIMSLSPQSGNTKPVLVLDEGDGTIIDILSCCNIWSVLYNVTK